MEHVREILHSYGIYQAEITQINHKIYKVDDGKQQFALKGSALAAGEISGWEHIYHLANKHQLVFILPVLLTKDHTLYRKSGGNIFYLTPWISGNTSTIRNFLNQIGKMHSQTRKSQSFPKQEIDEQLRSLKRNYENNKQQLLTYVKIFESHRYMAPLELQVCTHYHDLAKVFKQVAEYIERLLEEDVDKVVWHNCLCHGNLQLSHFIDADQNYFINWEKARFDYMVTDLVILFKNEIIYYDAPINEYIDSFDEYMRVNKLSQSELLLLFIHLLDVTSYMEIIREYVEKRPALTMIHQIKKIQTLYRQLILAGKFTYSLSEKYTSVLKHPVKSTQDKKQ